MNINKDSNSDSEISNDIEEKLKKIEEIDEALRQFMNFTTNDENNKIIESLINFNSIIEGDQRIKNVEEKRNAKKEFENDLLMKQKSYNDKCEKSNQLRAEIANTFSFLDDQEHKMYLK